MASKKPQVAEEFVHPNPSGARYESDLMLRDGNGKYHCWKMAMDYGAIIAMQRAAKENQIDMTDAGAAEQAALQAYGMSAFYRRREGITVSYEEFLTQLPRDGQGMAKFVSDVLDNIIANTPADKIEALGNAVAAEEPPA